MKSWWPFDHLAGHAGVMTIPLVILAVRRAQMKQRDAAEMPSAVLAARRAQMNPEDIIAVPSAAVATKGA